MMEWHVSFTPPSHVNSRDLAGNCIRTSAFPILQPTALRRTHNEQSHAVAKYRQKLPGAQ